MEGTTTAMTLDRALAIFQESQNPKSISQSAIEAIPSPASPKNPSPVEQAALFADSAARKIIDYTGETLKEAKDFESPVQG